MEPGYVHGAGVRDSADSAVLCSPEIFCGGHRDHRNQRIGGKGFEDSSCFDGYTEQAVSEDLR